MGKTTRRFGGRALKQSLQPPSNVLTEVVTIAEASRHWRKAMNTIRLARDDGRIDARRAPRVWLISVSSLIALWGDPVVPLGEWELNK